MRKAHVVNKACIVRKANRDSSKTTTTWSSLVGEKYICSSYWSLVYMRKAHIVRKAYIARKAHTASMCHR